MVDLDERIKIFLTTSLDEEDENGGDTFAERAEWYYQKRPHLLSLLKDLYNGYLTLLNSSSCRHHCRNRSISSHQIKAIINDDIDVESETESTLSYQQPVTTSKVMVDPEQIISELVIKNVENDILANQLNEMEMVRRNESSKKIELLKNLIEVLESERTILANENVNLSYKVSMLLEENRGLAAEAMFMKRKVAELGGCVLRMREDFRVCVLSRKIEDLQQQICGLEKRNREYYEILIKRDVNNEREENKMKKMSGSEFITLEGCLTLKQRNSSLPVKEGKSSGGGDDGRGKKLWQKLKKMELFNCGLPRSCSS